MASFYSERTAEYTLIPKFLKILEPLGAVVPIFFSGRREDTLVAFDSLSGDRFQLVAFFARRPKINMAQSRLIEGKINSRLFRAAQSASSMGVPTFCGISLTNNVFDQAVADSVWFDISELDGYKDERFFCEVSADLKLEMFRGQIQPKNHLAILSKVSSSPVLDWEQVTSIMREIPKLADESKSDRFMFFSNAWRLKPVYFVIRRKFD